MAVFNLLLTAHWPSCAPSSKRVKTSWTVGLNLNRISCRSFEDSLRMQVAFAPFRCCRERSSFYANGYSVLRRYSSYLSFHQKAKWRWTDAWISKPIGVAGRSVSVETSWILRWKLCLIEEN